MALEMPFEMMNLTSFPMEELCYDLKFEVLKEMDAKDTVELVKVNAGFQWMLSRNPWLVFDHHVHYIKLNNGIIRLEKSPPLFSPFRDFPVELGTDLHLPLITRIDSCDCLHICFGHEQLSDECAKILSQFSSVNRLWLHVYRDECLLKLLKNFRPTIEKSAVIRVMDLSKENRVTNELFENFIVNQVNNCRHVDFNCSSAAEFHFYYDAFAKTSVKFLNISAFKFRNISHFEEIVRSIVQKRIPSKNLQALFQGSTWDFTFDSPEMARIVDFLSQFRGMKRLQGENEQEVIQVAIKLFEEYVVPQYLDDLTHALCFRRKIDSDKDCIYMLNSKNDDDDSIQFYAFYIPSQSEMMMF